MKYCEKKCIDSWLLLRCDQILNGQKLCIKETWLFVEKCRYIMKLQEGVKSLPTQLTVTCDHFLAVVMVSRISKMLRISFFRTHLMI